jgi:16S rRNA (guanine966-N2)-methyltransferase
VREAWFSILHIVRGRVIDIYAGTGALGFEALSRGAESVTFVESAAPAQTAILKNATTLGVTDRITLIRSPVERAVSAIQRGGPYDLIVTDPPWTAMDAAERALRSLLRHELVAENGRIVVGHPKGRPVALDPSAGLELVDQRSWGDSGASFFEVSPRTPV